MSPIRASEQARYPKDWPAISRRIRIERAGNRCESAPGQPSCRAQQGERHPITGAVVVLTVAHLDHQPENCAEDNLRALCQRCHLRHDAKHHAKNAARTRRDAKQTGELFQDRNSGSR